MKLWKAKKHVSLSQGNMSCGVCRLHRLAMFASTPLLTSIYYSAAAAAAFVVTSLLNIILSPQNGQTESGRARVRRDSITTVESTPTRRGQASTTGFIWVHFG